MFAALDIATGWVTGPPCFRVPKFLDEIEAAVPHELDIPLVMHYCVTHKTPLIQRWLAKRLRWHVHPTLSSSSWLNEVERFFASLPIG